MKLIKTLGLLLGAALAVQAPVQAQNFPNKPINLMVPYPAGGLSDIIARKINVPLGTELKQPVIIENLGGAGGAIAAQKVLNATDAASPLQDQIAGDARQLSASWNGLLAAGGSVAAAFHEIYFLERACQAQIQALSCGMALNIPDEAVCRHTAAQFDRDGIDGIIDLAWQAALSLIDGQRAEWCN